VIGVHFNSKGPDDPLYGSSQPPVFDSTVQRELQAQVVRDFVEQLFDEEASAHVIVLGDLNDYAFSDAVQTLALGSSPARDLDILLTTLPANEQYSYVYEGNSQALDQVLVSQELADALITDGFDVVHVNAEFADQASDHDPQVARFLLPA
jgi:predicted extracellular nuclease